MNSKWIDKRGKNLFEVNTFAFLKKFDNQVGLVLANNSVNMLLQLEIYLASEISTSWVRLTKFQILLCLGEWNLSSIVFFQNWALGNMMASLYVNRF